MRASTLRRRNILGVVLLALISTAHRINAQAAPSPGAIPIPSSDSGANQPQPAPTESATTAADSEPPGVIYKEAMHPLEIVRQSLENWSDPELSALHLGMKTALDACNKMSPDDYTRDDLYDLAHLCAFGQDWSPANVAAQRYIALKAPEHRAQAYAISVGAFVHLNAIDLALATTQEMLEREPYDAEVAYTLRYMKDALEAAGNPKALDLAEEEHPKIIDALRKGSPLKATFGDAAVSIGLLYEMAMEGPFFARYAGNDTRAAALITDIELALPTNATLTSEDHQEIDSTKLQYHLLGTKLQTIPIIRSYKSLTAKAKIEPIFGAATVFVAFPDWCVQCKKMMPEMTLFAAANAQTPVYTCGLLFKQSGETSPSDPEKELLGTNVMEIPEEIARRFGAIDFPLGIVVDHSGTIRRISVLPSDAFSSNGYMQRVITQVSGVQVKGAQIKPVSQ